MPLPQWKFWKSFQSRSSLKVSIGTNPLNTNSVGEQKTMTMNNLVNQKAMKNLFKLSILAAFTMVFAACANEEMEPVAPQMKTITVTLDEVATRTTLNDAHTGLNWVVGDKFGYFTDGTGGANNTAVEYTEGAVTYTIQVPVDATEIKAYYPYYDTNTATSVSLGMSNKQTQEAGGVFVGENYPMAAIATIDENNNTVLKFTPVASALAFNVYNTAEHDVTEAVKSITLTTSEKSYGYIAYDFTTGVTGTPWGNSITITMTEPVVIGNAKPADTKIGESQIYLTLHKKEAYTNATVVVETTVNTYTFEYATLDCNNDFKVINLNLSRGTTPEPMQPLSGDYVIVAKDDSGVYHAMNCDKNNGKTRLDFTTLEAFDPTAESYMTDDDKIKWTFAARDDKYTVQNVENSGYLAFTTAGANMAVTTETAYLLTISYSSTTEGAYYITLKDETTDRWLAKNGTNGFAFYKSDTGINDLYIIPAVADTRETLATPQNLAVELVNGTTDAITVSWDAVTNAQTYEVTCGEQTVSVDAPATSTTISSLAVGEYTISVVAKSADYKTSDVATKPWTIQLAANATIVDVSFDSACPAATPDIPSGTGSYEANTVKTEYKIGDYSWGLYLSFYHSSSKALWFLSKKNAYILTPSISDKKLTKITLDITGSAGNAKWQLQDNAGNVVSGVSITNAAVNTISIPEASQAAGARFRIVQTGTANGRIKSISLIYEDAN